MTSILYDDAVIIISQELQLQLVRDARDVIDDLIDPAPEVVEWDESGREIHPYVADEMLEVALDNAFDRAKRWETLEDPGIFFYFVAAEVAIKLIEYRDNILLLGEPSSHQMTLLRNRGGLAGWGFMQTCALLLSSKLIAREYQVELKLKRDQPAQLERFKAYLDRVANKQTTHARDLALILQDLARPDEDGTRADDGSPTPANAASPDLGEETTDGQGAPDASGPEAAGSAPHAGDDEAAQRTPVGNGSANGPAGSHETTEAGHSWAFKGLLAVSAVVVVLVLVAAAGGRGWLWDRSDWQPVPPSAGPQQPPFPRDALAEVGMPLKPNVLLRLTGLSDGSQRWTSQSVSGSAPALPVPLDITPIAGDDDQHKVIKVSLDLQLRDLRDAADPGLLISASGDYPLSIKDGGDYATTLITPKQQIPQRVHPLTAKGDDTPLSLDGNGVWTFQFYVDLGDPALYQCGYHVRSINVFAELDPKYPNSKSPNSKIVDTLPIALLRKCGPGPH